MSFVGYDYIRQRAAPPEENGAVLDEMFDDQ